MSENQEGLITTLIISKARDGGYVVTTPDYSFATPSALPRCCVFAGSNIHDVCEYISDYFFRIEQNETGKK